MATAIRLTVITGPHKGRRFCFCGPMRCQAGRALDCFIQFVGTERDDLISRHHCLLDVEPNVNPPSLRVWDLGSTNGTFVNAREVECQPESLSEKAGVLMKPGDVLTIGGTTLEVEMVDCPDARKVARGLATWESGAVGKSDCLLPC